MPHIAPQFTRSDSQSVSTTRPESTRRAPSAELATVHMFWHGRPLSRVERLSMASFIACGHVVDLHVYDEPVGVPVGVHLRDAGETLPRETFFAHPLSSSIAPFSDWFRNELLFREGGVWSDADVVCLRPLDIGDTFFGWQDGGSINNAIVGVPPRSALTADLLAVCRNPNRIRRHDSVKRMGYKIVRRVTKGSSPSVVYWGETGPGALTRSVQYLRLSHLAYPPKFFYPVPWSAWRSVFGSATEELRERIGESYTVHLWNEAMRGDPEFDRDAHYPTDSLFEEWCRIFGVD